MYWGDFLNGLIICMGGWIKIALIKKENNDKAVAFLTMYEDLIPNNMVLTLELTNRPVRIMGDKK